MNPLWPIPADAEEKIAPAFEGHRCMTASELVDLCRQDKAQFWDVDGFYGITQVRLHKNGLCLYVMAGAGKMNKEAMRHVEQWAMSKGCTEIMVTGRKGWARYFDDYKLQTVTLTKELKTCHKQ